MKPQYKTSEFWFTVVSFIFSGLFLLGVLTDFDQKEELVRDVSHGVESLFLIGGQLLILYRYINSRKEVKKAEADVELAKEINKVIEKPKPKTKTTKRKPQKTPKKATSTARKKVPNNDKSRTNQTRSRKAN